ncbi:hypothetical protein AB4Y43_01135 [Paraburkholderia sp. BR10872]|uniref:hypothetical protein n=1 Tax=Paraburkholderia sp. BR10872 TaxID=3236989 RepID=UPI0034D2B706
MCDHEYNPDSSAIATAMLREARERLEGQRGGKAFRSIEEWERHYLPNGIPELPQLPMLADGDHK